MATLEGALTTLGEHGVRGAQVALKQAGGKLLGKDSLSGSEGIAIRDYSKTVPNVTVRQRFLRRWRQLL
jgi:branched-chain amino acid transport system substrate-binding protein